MWLAALAVIPLKMAVNDCVVPAVAANVKLFGPSTTVITPVTVLASLIITDVENAFVAGEHAPGVAVRLNVQPLQLF